MLLFRGVGVFLNPIGDFFIGRAGRNKVFQFLRADTRFQDLVNRIGFPG